MSNNEYPARHSPERATDQQLHTIFKAYTDSLPESGTIDLSPSDIFTVARAATEMPFDEIDSASISHVTADYDKEAPGGGTIYPEIIAVTINGCYGWPTMLYTVSFVIAHNPLEHTEQGFAVQQLHTDMDSYEFADPDSKDNPQKVFLQPAEIIRTIAGDIDRYQEVMALNAAHDSSSKRTAELRLLDKDDLSLLIAALDTVNTLREDEARSIL